MDPRDWNRYSTGVFKEFKAQAESYTDVLRQLAELEGRLQMMQSTISRARAAFAEHVGGWNDTSNPYETKIPKDWQDVWASIRFVGKRLGDAAVEVLQESQEPLDTHSIRWKLTYGGYRFRTANPDREVHAALLRVRDAERLGDKWICTR